jgi:hypothetical protein
MHDQPEPTEQEQEQAPERLEEEHAKLGAGHEDPEQHEPEEDDAA